MKINLKKIKLFFKRLIKIRPSLFNHLKRIFARLKKGEDLTSYEFTAYKDVLDDIERGAIFSFQWPQEKEYALKNLFSDDIQLIEHQPKTSKHSDNFLRKESEPKKISEWACIYNHDFSKSLKNFDKIIQKRISEAISNIMISPMKEVSNTVKPLKYNLAGVWGHRIGDYRLLYVPHPTKHQIVFISFASRGSVY